MTLTVSTATGAVLVYAIGYKLTHLPDCSLATAGFFFVILKS